MVGLSRWLRTPRASRGGYPLAGAVQPLTTGCLLCLQQVRDVGVGKAKAVRRVRARPKADEASPPSRYTF